MPVSSASPASWWLLSFDLPADWNTAETELHIEGATRPYEIYVNGARAGSCTHAFVPAEFPVTRLLRPGANLVSLHFLDSDIDPQATPAWDSGINPRAHTTPSLYGETTLAGFPAQRIERVRIWPDLRRKQMELEVDTTAGGKLHVHVDGLPIHHEFAAGELRTTIDLPGVVVMVTAPAPAARADD